MPRETKLEKEFRLDVFDELQVRLPGCRVLILDPMVNFQGIPDRIVLWRDRWAVLEFKRASNSAQQANQEHYIREFGEMAFSSFINPQNREEVLDALESALRA